MMDLAFVIEEEGIQIPLHRKIGGQYNADGLWVNETTQDTTIVAVVQPAKGAQLLDLPEGERADARYFLWTPATLALDDVVNYGDANYRVSFVWPRPDGGFTRAAVGLIGG
jgi:hypothetical protein